jgi:putative ATPase
VSTQKSKPQDDSRDMFQRHFEELRGKEAPLAARMRPVNLEEFVGQEQLVGKGRVLRKAIEAGQLPSIILWGPPGSGKTTLAYVIANTTNSHFSGVSAVTAGVADLRRIIEEAKERRGMHQQKTILFIDEIHRFNKSQQDAILPFVEDGTITLIGATTENPSFEVTSPLLSRSRVFSLNPLTKGQVRTIIQRAVTDKKRGLGDLNVALDEDALNHLLTMAKGDARIALNALEMAALTTPADAEGKRHVPLATVEDAIHWWWLWRPSRRSTLSACRRAIWPWRKPRSIWPPRRRAIHSTPPILVSRRKLNRATASQCLCTCATR